MTEEQYLIDCLTQLWREYEKAAKPIIDRIAAIRSTHLPPPIVVDASRIDPEILKAMLRDSGDSIEGVEEILR